MATDVVSGALVSSFLKVVFDRLASPGFFDFFGGRGLDGTLLEKLGITLLSINAVVEDAEQKKIGNSIVKAWLDDVKDAVYDADDILDEVDYEVTKRKVETEFQASTGKVRNKEIEARMIRVLKNLEYLAHEKERFRLEIGDAGARRIMSKSFPRTSLMDESAIIGRDGDKETIINWLLSDNHNSSQLSIISIVGMGGLGKTVLARLVFNDERMLGEFDLRAWIWVSDDFDVLRITTEIIWAITMSVSNDDTENLHMLQNKLKEVLTGKRFLLVLDDLWNEDYMLSETLLTPLRYGALGSKILVTTRSDIVASTICSTEICQLKPLSVADAWRLFSTYAFPKGPLDSNSDFEVIGRKIIEKCKGLPLALKIFGGLLCTKSSLDEWNIILTCEIWRKENNMLPVLRLSYDHLPSLLKRCFAYCSLFPRNYEFEKEELIQLWQAESFLPSEGTGEVGDQFFNDLLSRSFFQQSSQDEKRFVMHNLLHELAKNVAGQFYFNLEAEEVCAIPKKTRHFSYTRNHLGTFKLEVYGARKLRTFLSFSMNHDKIFSNISSMMLHDILSKLQCLRVLSLPGYSNIIELPVSIGNLKHLRYLNLSGTGVERIPDSICLLYNLQTLKLRHCESLEELPSDLHKLINLYHLDFGETKVREIPKQLGKLKKLQVLSSFHVSKYSATSIKQLGELNFLRELSVLELQNVVYPMDALEAKLKDKIYLEKLTLGWSTNDDKSHHERNVLDKLQPHQNLKKLSVSNYGGIKFPVWFTDNTLSNVVSLELVHCKNCFFLPSLGVLPSLKSLSISGFDTLECIGSEFYGNNSCITPFRSLEILRFQDMARWEEWECEHESSAFPYLQELYIVRCPRLKEHLPAQLPSLRKLVIDKCERLVEWDLHSYTSLQQLHIEGAAVESLADAGLLPPTLTSFTLCKCSNLRTLDNMDLCYLSALEQLILMDCPQLQHLPNEGLPKSLSTLQIVGCPLLRERCQIQIGKDWEKIAHILSVKIDDKIIT